MRRSALPSPVVAGVLAFAIAALVAGVGTADAASLRLSLSDRSVEAGTAVTVRVRPALPGCSLRLHRGSSTADVLLRRRVPRSGRVVLRRLGGAGRRTVVVRCGRRTAKAALVVRPAPAAPVVAGPGVPAPAPPAAPSAPPAAPPAPPAAAPAPPAAPPPAAPADPWPDTSRFAWQPVFPPPELRGEAQGAAVGSRLFVFGGFTSGVDLDTTARSDAYDATADAWQRIADLPVEITHAPAVVDGTTIYLLGGYVGDHPGPATAQVWKYAVPSNTWSAGPPLPQPRGAGGATIVGRELHFFGGTSRNGSNGDPDQGDHWALALDGGTTWQPRRALPNPRNHLAAATLNGNAYAIGGQHAENEQDGNQSQVDSYDPATDTWTRRADMPAARGHVSSSAVVVGGRIVVIGGTEQGNVASAAVTVYDPATDTWSALPSLPQGRKTPVADLIDGDLYVATGSFRSTTLRGRFQP